jgi:putative flippase GtrA
MSVLVWEGPISRRVIAREIVLFALVGALNTAADFSTLNLLVAITHIHQGPALFALNGVSFTVAVILSYVLNTRLTFRQRDVTDLRQLARFIGVSVVGLLLNSTAVLLAAPWFDRLQSPTLAVNAGKLLATGVSLCWNYLAMRRFVYAPRRIVGSPAKAARSSAPVIAPASGVRIVRPVRPVTWHPQRG